MQTAEELGLEKVSDDSWSDFCVLYYYKINEAKDTTGKTTMCVRESNTEEIIGLVRYLDNGDKEYFINKNAVSLTREQYD